MCVCVCVCVSVCVCVCVCVCIFVQLGFSSNIASDMVALTNFIKNFNFCGVLYFDSLAD